MENGGISNTHFIVVMVLLLVLVKLYQKLLMMFNQSEQLRFTSQSKSRNMDRFQAYPFYDDTNDD